MDAKYLIIVVKFTSLAKFALKKSDRVNFYIINVKTIVLLTLS